MKEFTQERNHLNANIVVKGSHTRVHIHRIQLARNVW